MSYALSAPLQLAVYNTLMSDADVAALVGTSIFDALPAGARPETYITLGEEDVRDQSDNSGAGALHRFEISVVTETAGYAQIKAVAAAVCDALLGSDLVLTRGRVVNMSFDRASARRSGKAGRLRRIDLRFRARVEDS
ncbi:MAG: DUF3168 domain-containing protein [Arenibacterium sp.]